MKKALILMLVFAAGLTSQLAAQQISRPDKKDNTKQEQKTDKLPDGKTKGKPAETDNDDNLKGKKGSENGKTRSQRKGDNGKHKGHHKDHKGKGKAKGHEGEHHHDGHHHDGHHHEGGQSEGKPAPNGKKMPKEGDAPTQRPRKDKEAMPEPKPKSKGRQ